MRWYDYVFGGSKSFQAFTASFLGFWGFMSLNLEQRASTIYQLFVFLAACAGVYGYFRIKETKSGKNGNGG